jgi:hypothetical protein
MTPTLMTVLLAAKLTLAAPAAAPAIAQATAEAGRSACKATYEVVDTTKVGFDATTGNNGCGNNGQCNRNC